MKKIVTSLITLTCSLYALASHISGGELFYEYLGPGSTPNTDSYKITMRLFRECESTGQQLNTEIVIIGVYNRRSDSTLFTTLPLNKQWSGLVPELHNTPGAIPCLTGDASLCYQIGTFSNTIELPKSPDGYILSWIRCCRQNTDNLNDEPFETKAAGATFVTQIPGTNLLPNRGNNSPQFVIKDTALVCAGNEFKLDFSAVDKDGDSLSYGFCAAYDGGSIADVNPSPFPVLSLVSLNYLPPYSGSFPLGPDATINPKTGIISGKAPASPGKYVVNVCVDEWRNDTLLNTHRKDFILKVGDCNFAAAELKPSYITCDGFNLTFENESTSANIHSYYWEFGDPDSSTDSSSNPTPTYTYKDSGTYPVKLVINRGEQCSDSTISKALVYPGFIPNFKVNGSCFFNPYQFIDLTTSKYGVVDSWHWDFGDPTVASDTSLLKNPTYKYSNVDSLDVQLIVTNSKGCTDTLAKSIIISDKPPVALPFHDTLICNVDTLRLHASTTDTSANFTWSPVININNINSPDPIVSPKSATTYVVTVNDKGCINTDSVKVNVISNVDLFAGVDTTICLTDTIQLQPVTNGLYFTWSPSAGLNDPSAKNPFAVPLSPIQYRVVASVGKCSAADDINIKVAPYPVANAGKDTSICFGETTVLKGTSSARNFAWFPTNSLLYANTLTPLAGPQSTTTYTLTVMDSSFGCPKPSSDTVIVHVIPLIPAFAGRDTTIVVGEPLQMNASGGTIYSWSPVTGMDNPNIPNPVVLLSAQYDSITYRLKVETPEGCYAYDDIKVTVFKTQPDIFVPTGFTPNKDGLNDILRPKVVGMKQFNYFKVFDRWGVMVFSTTQEGRGWDGTYSGTAQPPGAYVFVSQAVDYTGKLITKKGTVVLIR